MSIRTKTGIPKGWFRQDLSFVVNSYMKSFKKNRLGICNKLTSVSYWSWVIKNEHGKTLAFGRDVNSKHALNACEEAYKLLK